MASLARRSNPQYERSAPLGDSIKENAEYHAATDQALPERKITGRQERRRRRPSPRRLVAAVLGFGRTTKRVGASVRRGLPARSPDAQLRGLDLALAVRSAVDRAGGADPVARPCRTNARLDVDHGYPGRRYPLAAGEDDVCVAPAVGVDALDVKHPTPCSAAVPGARRTLRETRHIRGPRAGLGVVGRSRRSADPALLSALVVARAPRPHGGGQKERECRRGRSHHARHGTAAWCWPTAGSLATLR